MNYKENRDQLNSNLNLLVNLSYELPVVISTKNLFSGEGNDEIDLSGRKDNTGYANGSKYVFNHNGKTYITHVSANHFAREECRIKDYFQYVPLSGIMVLKDDNEQKKVNAVCLKAAEFFGK